jgi:beta-lactamase regulating signal transducer with metallopeptidase domain
LEATVLQQWISTRPAELLIASIWQGLLLTAFAWATLKLAGRLRASTRFTVWFIVFTLVALLPIFSLGRALWSAPFAQVAASLLPQGRWSIRVNAGWAFAMEAAWAIASLCSVVRLGVSMVQMARMYRRSTPLEFASLGQEMQSVVNRSVVSSSSSRPVQVRLSDAVDAPSVIGFFRPAIVIPRALWSELPGEEMKQVLRHEMAHLERGDDWTNLLQKLFRSLCPLNPALLWAERHLCREREQACDDAVLDAEGNARAYATCLTKLAESRLVKRAALLAPGLWRRHSELAARVDNILHRRKGLHPLVSRGLVTASLVMSLGAVFTLELCPRLVTFADAESQPAEIATSPLANTVNQAARFYHASFHRQQQPRYQDAVFHQPARAAIVPSSTARKQAVLPKPAGRKPVGKNVHSKTSVTRKMPANGLRFVELSSDDASAGTAWILFTVEAGADASYHDAVFTNLPDLSIPDNWIFFQI